jgi:hypothetical protein
MHSIDMNVVIMMVNKLILNISRPDHRHQFGFAGSASVRQSQGHSVGAKMILPIRGCGGTGHKVFPL